MGSDQTRMWTFVLERTIAAKYGAKMRISAAPATVLAFLTDARQMMSWLAQSAKADARPGGIFRLADLNGLWVEGTCVEAIPHQGVVFTWGGIEGLRPGQ